MARDGAEAAEAQLPMPQAREDRGRSGRQVGCAPSGRQRRPRHSMARAQRGHVTTRQPVRQLGGVGASILAGSIRAFLFDVQPYNPAVFVSAGIVIAATGLAAAWMPARWAARVDPIVAMRQ